MPAVTTREPGNDRITSDDEGSLDGDDELHAHDLTPCGVVAGHVDSELLCGRALFRNSQRKTLAVRSCRYRQRLRLLQGVAPEQGVVEQYGCRRLEWQPHIRYSTRRPRRRQVLQRAVGQRFCQDRLVVQRQRLTGLRRPHRRVEPLNADRVSRDTTILPRNWDRPRRCGHRNDRAEDTKARCPQHKSPHPG